RRRRPHAVSAVLLAGRGARQLPAGRRYPHQAAHDGARGIPHRMAREEAARRHHGARRARRQRGYAHRGVRDQERDLRLRRGAGDRGSLPAAGAGTGPQEARGDAVPNPADHARPRDARADLRAGVSVGRELARRGKVRGSHQRLLILRPVRGSQAQAGEVALVRLRTWLLVVVAYALVVPPAEAADTVWDALRAPGSVVVLRHSYAPGGFDPPDARLDDCSTQRNLDE